MENVHVNRASRGEAGRKLASLSPAQIEGIAKVCHEANRAYCAERSKTYQGIAEAMAEQWGVAA